MKRVVVRPAAAAEIEDVYQWYESQQPGLGEEFLVALNAIRDQIVDHPEAFAVLRRNTRRALIPRRFPYGVFYRFEEETIIIVACQWSGPACGGPLTGGVRRRRPDQREAGPIRVRRGEKFEGQESR